jgi:hypothetical protein
MKFYAVFSRISNVERIFSFDTKKERDTYVSEGDHQVRSICYKSLLYRLALNRRIVKQHKNDSGWVNGLPTTMNDIERKE